ncbi:hypothetical protein HDU87_004062 [Geranomyces variabilis]|uniref:Uncharacterized protein n=1 Tax=Geranomyces variabilis TaxID=109894 RepID=A0AAD5TTA1_9FUNG|nr:hypothetical protein HDU87_004062 [Geranomyces variabilis]
MEKTDMEQGQGDTVKIQDLAQEGKKVAAAAAHVPAIPLVILAPLLVVVALLSVVLPISFILGNASQDTAGYLSSKYLASVISGVQSNVEAPVNAFIPVVETASHLPSVRATLLPNNADPTVTGMRTSSAAPDLIAVQQNTGLFVLECMKARWKFRLQTQPVRNKHGFTIRRPISQPKLTIITYFMVEFNQWGLTLALINYLVFANPTDVYPAYGCSAGLRVDSQWSQLLQNAKPTTDSVVAIFSLGTGDHFTILASSNMVLPAASGGKIYTYQVPDDVTNSLQQNLQVRYANNSDLATAAAASASSASFEVTLSSFGRSVVNLGIAQAGSYASGRLLIAVALPRSEVRLWPTASRRADKWLIESAQARSRAVSLGIASAVVVAVAAVFFVVALTLKSLTTQMVQLTKLDFSTLESSKALDKRSLIWELRRLQAVFATMVRAFAGAIQRNKAMSRASAAMGGSSTGKKGSASAAT